LNPGKSPSMSGTLNDSCDVVVCTVAVLSISFCFIVTSQKPVTAVLPI
jgi:hypothetical protein